MNFISHQWKLKEIKSVKSDQCLKLSKKSTLEFNAYFLKTIDKINCAYVLLTLNFHNFGIQFRRIDDRTYLGDCRGAREFQDPGSRRCLCKRVSWYPVWRWIHPVRLLWTSKARTVRRLRAYATAPDIDSTWGTRAPPPSFGKYSRSSSCCDCFRTPSVACRRRRNRCQDRWAPASEASRTSTGCSPGTTTASTDKIPRDPTTIPMLATTTWRDRERAPPPSPISSAPRPAIRQVFPYKS